MFTWKLGWHSTCLVTTGAPKVHHIGNTIKNANVTSISCHSHSFRVTEGINSFIFYFNGSGSNAFRTCSKGSRFSRTLNGTIGPVLVSHPNPNSNLVFGPVRFGFGLRFRTEPSHHYMVWKSQGDPSDCQWERQAVWYDNTTRMDLIMTYKKKDIYRKWYEHGMSSPNKYRLGHRLL